MQPGVLHVVVFVGTVLPPHRNIGTDDWDLHSACAFPVTKCLGVVADHI